MTPDQITEGKRLSAEFSPGKETDGQRKETSASSDEFEATNAKAEAGNAQAQYNLADWYFNAQNFAEAVKWYRKAADQNNPDAQIRLATCYNAGLGVAQDFAEGTKWYRKAAEENCAEAQLYLAGRCKTG